MIEYADVIGGFSSTSTKQTLGFAVQKLSSTILYLKNNNQSKHCVHV